MAQPVKLSDGLINAARESAPTAHRSLAAQVEHWATLGRSIEGALTMEQTTSLKRAVREPHATYGATNADTAAALAQALSVAVSPVGRSDFRHELVAAGQPLFGTDPAFPGFIVRKNADGSMTPGRWSDNQFVPVQTPVKSAPRARRSHRSQGGLVRA
jgi:ParD-like antitoxin of type II bacterial toxin-antitoxin system